jgi:hypothetical protein
MVTAPFPISGHSSRTPAFSNTVRKPISRHGGLPDRVRYHYMSIWRGAAGCPAHRSTACSKASWSNGNVFPVWKRGTIASDPDLPVEGHPKFYVKPGQNLEMV